jgi:hypothetical protein
VWGRFALCTCVHWSPLCMQLDAPECETWTCEVELPTFVLPLHIALTDAGARTASVW